VGGDLASVADRLRLVQEARRKFLRLWAIDHSMIDPLVDRLVVDLFNLPPSQPPSQPPAEAGAGAGWQEDWAEQDSAAHPDAPPVDES
jgi:hypothetical protein